MKHILNFLPCYFAETVLHQDHSEAGAVRTIHLWYLSGKGVLFPLASVSDLPESRPASEVCGPVSTRTLIWRLLFVSIFP